MSRGTRVASPRRRARPAAVDERTCELDRLAARERVRDPVAVVVDWIEALPRERREDHERPRRLGSWTTIGTVVVCEPERSLSSYSPPGRAGPAPGARRRWRGRDRRLAAPAR